MNYSWEDIIFSPDDPRAKNAIRKKCYFSNNAYSVICNANNDKHRDTLVGVKQDTFPFVVNSCYDYKFIIVRKEQEKKKYRPFNASELLSLIGKVIKRSDCHRTNYLIIRTDILSVSIIERDETILEYKADELLENFAFADGTPCGVEIEEEKE